MLAFLNAHTTKQGRGRYIVELIEKQMELEKAGVAEMPRKVRMIVDRSW
jgi:hypothetical protein